MLDLRKGVATLIQNLIVQGDCNAPTKSPAKNCQGTIVIMQQNVHCLWEILRQMLNFWRKWDHWKRSAWKVARISSQFFCTLFLSMKLMEAPRTHHKYQKHPQSAENTNISLKNIYKVFDHTYIHIPKVFFILNSKLNDLWLIFISTDLDSSQ